MADNQDLDEGTIVDDNGNFERIRTDRERYEEKTENGEPKYSKDATISLEEVYDHVKMHYRKDTNCISLSSNGNVSIAYGRGNYKDRYVMVKVPKQELGERVINAGQYMLREIERRVEEYLSTIKPDSKLTETISEIDNSKTEEEIRNAIRTRYTSKEELDVSRAKLNKGITYRSPVARISSYQALNEEQLLEKNKIIAKLTLLEREGGMQPVIPHTANNNLLVQTVGNAFSSLELIHYGDIPKDEIIDVPKEIVDIFSLLQQVEGQEQQVISDLKREVIRFANEGRRIEVPEDSSLFQEYAVRDNIEIKEMYELTGGMVEYGRANSAVRDIFYLARAQKNARELSRILNQITGDNPKYKEVIQHIADNGFRIEPSIITRKSNRGTKLSESISLDIRGEESELIDKIRKLTDAEQIEVMENGGLSDVREVMSTTFSKSQREQTISREEYYAEAMFSLYDWERMGIEEFTIPERNHLIQRIQNEHPVELYQKLRERGTNRREIPTILLNMATRENDFEITEDDTPESIKEKRLEQYDRMIEASNPELTEELSIERIERFLGYYDVARTEIKLRPYQQRTVERTEEILENERFASVILPTGGGKSFVALSQLMKHQNEEMLYLAPQNEMLEQLKDNIIKYIHGPINTIRRSKDEIVADVFPNLKFATYPRLLSREGAEIIRKQYGFVVLDELHRTGAKEWGEKLNTLIDNQPGNAKVLGITATPRRDVDGMNMANEMAERLGYTNQEAVSGKHIAMNMSLTNAIRMGLVVNPKLISCVYSLVTEGNLGELREKIELIEEVQEKNEKIEIASLQDVSITYITCIEEISKEKMICRILERNPAETETRIYIHVIQGIPKADKMEWIIEKGTELGVKEFTPFMLKRCIVKLEPKEEEKKQIRWRKIARAAAEQSKRNQIPIINKPQNIEKVFQTIQNYDIVLVAYEGEKENTLKQELKKLDTKRNLKVAVIVGPEGGIEEIEIEKMKEMGAKIISLGKRILRTETASLVVASNIIYELE